MNIQNVWVFKPTDSDRFSDAFDVFMAEMCKDTVPLARKLATQTLIEEFCEAGLLIRAPIPNAYYAADVDWALAFDIWRFYEVYRDCSRSGRLFQATSSIH